MSGALDGVVVVDLTTEFWASLAGALLADFGARWLGWDVRRGAAAVQLDLPGLRDATEAPRKYGFHGTLKPPFRLAEGQDFDALRDAVAALPAPARALPDDMLALCDYITPNETEAAALTGLPVTSQDEAAAAVGHCCHGHAARLARGASAGESRSPDVRHTDVALRLQRWCSGRTRVGVVARGRRRVLLHQVCVVSRVP